MWKTDEYSGILKWNLPEEAVEQWPLGEPKYNLCSINVFVFSKSN